MWGEGVSLKDKIQLVFFPSLHSEYIQLACGKVVFLMDPPFSPHLTTGLAENELECLEGL